MQKAGLILFCLLLLSSCSTTAVVRTVTVSKIQPQLPPLDMINQRMVPPFNEVNPTNQDLLEYCLKLVNEIHHANSDFQRLQLWRERKANEYHN